MFQVFGLRQCSKHKRTRRGKAALQQEGFSGFFGGCFGGCFVRSFGHVMAHECTGVDGFVFNALLYLNRAADAVEHLAAGASRVARILRPLDHPKA